MLKETVVSIRQIETAPYLGGDAWSNPSQHPAHTCEIHKGCIFKISLNNDASTEIKTKKFKFCGHITCVRVVAAVKYL